ncbi:MFS transporter [Sphingomonas sp. Mn802worker]|uniref:MFS transporter n=1 Tax=Sphingomonas sp. Mn802worker TaxID=629773 RepID=UPI0003784361|nr:MFS transporter [Sphingomonas sp. Mn802worker]
MSASTMSNASEASWPRRNYAWYVVACLTIAYALAILDRVSIGLLITPLQAALKINDTQFGLLQGMAFSICYSVLGLPLGMLCDRSHRVSVLIGGLVLWSFATIGCSFAATFHQLFVARMLVGIGEAALVPVATSLIADYFAPQIRPKAYGVFVTGSSLGTAAAFTLSGLFLSWADRLIALVPVFNGMAAWQVVFILCGAPGLVLALVLLVSFREPKRHGVVSVAQGFSLGPIMALFRAHPKAFATLMIGTVLNLVCVYAIVGWFPALFIRAHGWSAAKTGYALGAVGLPISTLAAFSSGWVIAWLMKHGHRDAPMIAAITCGCSMAVFGALGCVVPSAALALALYGLNALFVNWNISAVYSGISQITPNELRGQVMALHNICSGLIALTAGNFIVGFLSDTIFHQAGGISYALGLVFLFFGLCAAVLLAFGRAAFRDAVQAYSERQAC